MITCEKVMRAIDRERRRNNISIVDFSDKLGVNYHTYYNWMRGYRKPDLYNFLNIVNVLNLDIKLVRKKTNERSETEGQS